MSNLDTNKNQLFEQALIYIQKMGWNVIPAGVNKKPLIEWKKYQSERVTEEQVREWFLNSETNIAVVTGKISNLLVVDIDPRHGGRDSEFENITTIKSATGGGGWHYFFQHEDGLQNSASIRPGIDIRAEGGYVVLPPSLHESGKRYKWINSPFETPLIRLPLFVKDWISNRSTNDKKIETKWDSSLLNGVQEGRRNDSAASVVGKLLKRYPKKEWDSEAWIHLKNWNEAKNKPPLPESELRQVFNSIAQRELIKDSETEIPQSKNAQLINTPLSYKEVESKVKALLPNSQNVLKLVLAIATSSSSQNPLMLWLLLVGVPSSGKTDMVRLIKDADVTYYLDNLTQNAFISGERSTRSNKVHDLLPLINKRCLIIKDWTSIFSLDEKMTKKLLGDLVGIYDKEFTKFSSRRGNISYSSAFSQLGCITPATLNRHTQYMNMVGPRFLCYTMPLTSLEDENLSYEAIFSDRDRSLIEKEARLYASSYLNQLTQKTLNINSLKDEVQVYLRLAAKLMANCRGIVVLQSASFKNEDGEDIKYYETLDVQIEEPWRAVQQLISLSKHLAFVVGNNEVGVDELSIIKEVVISSMPADRSQALRSIQEHEGQITAKELSDISEKSTKTSRRLLVELESLKALEKIQGSGTIATEYRIAEQFMDFILLDPAEFLSRNQASGTETTDGIETKEIDGNDEQLVLEKGFEPPNF